MERLPLTDHEDPVRDPIMVPLSQRRHRLHGEEIPEVLRGLELRLREHLETESDLLGATIAFQAFYRLLKHRSGRPKYPEPVTWNVIAEWIHFYRQTLEVRENVQVS